jgi:hypothetical protein
MTATSLTNIEPMHLRRVLLWLIAVPWPGVITALCVSAAFLIGVEKGVFMGAGPDASCYVSQADLWVRGALTSPLPEWAPMAPFQLGSASATPVGYTADPSNTRMVPVCAPGLPIMMALFQRVGGRDAVFYVVPLFGALLVWIGSRLGRMMAGPWAGAIAATLLLLTPPFLLMLVQPMTDIPAAACWSAAILLAWRPRMRDAVAAGVVTAVAVLVRPNTVPLAVIPALLLLSRRDTRIARVLVFAGAVAPAALLIAVLNARWYGSPLKSGYGALDVLYSRKNVAPNVRLYAGWFIAAQTPLAFLWLAVACALPERRSERYRLVLVSVIYPAAVLAIYVAYFPWHEWAYLRFLLPAYPVVCAALGAVFVAFAHNVRPARLGVVAVVTVVASLGIQQFRYASDAGVFRMAAGNQRFARAVEFANRLPPSAILVSTAYSGTLRFYTRRQVLRWETIRPDELDHALVYLHDRGYLLYFIGDPFEEADFKAHFARTDATRQFDRLRFPDVGYGFVAADLTPQ